MPPRKLLDYLAWDIVNGGYCQQNHSLRFRFPFVSIWKASATCPSKLELEGN